jgi:hypothetical protein
MILHKEEFEIYGMKCVVMELTSCTSTKEIEFLAKIAPSLFSERGSWYVGYVRVKLTHPAACADDHPFNVHGGITWTNSTIQDYGEQGYFWLGWDSAHGTKFSLEEAIEETKNLAVQLYYCSPEVHGLI